MSSAEGSSAEDNMNMVIAHFRIIFERECALFVASKVEDARGDAILVLFSPDRECAEMQG